MPGIAPAEPASHLNGPQGVLCGPSASLCPTGIYEMLRMLPREPQRFRGFRPCLLGFGFLKVIGAPGFEPGTSPTRTVRATRLRHAPIQTPVSHTAIVG
jgi:hypothetical protein